LITGPNNGAPFRAPRGRGSLVGGDIIVQIGHKQRCPGLFGLLMPYKLINAALASLPVLIKYSPAVVFLWMTRWFKWGDRGMWLSRVYRGESERDPLVRRILKSRQRSVTVAATDYAYSTTRRFQVARYAKCTSLRCS
jgi:hypothetical protein